MKMLNKTVRVTWLDVLVMSGWLSLDEIKETNPPRMYSIGRLIDEDKDTIRLVGLADELGNGNAIQIIPKGCILKIEVINDCSCTVTKEGRDTMAVEEQV